MAKDFFISYNSADRDWAVWIAWQLEQAKYSVVIQDWDFQAGGNFALQMDRALRETQRVLAVLSESYLAALYTHPEWAAAFKRDPLGKDLALVPVRVQQCAIDGLLAQLSWIDLSGQQDEAAARQSLLDGVSPGRKKPSVSPPFPPAAPSKPPYPSKPPLLVEPQTPPALTSPLVLAQPATPPATKQPLPRLPSWEELTPETQRLVQRLLQLLEDREFDRLEAVVDGLSRAQLSVPLVRQLRGFLLGAIRLARDVACRNLNALKRGLPDCLARLETPPELFRTYLLVLTRAVVALASVLLSLARSPSEREAILRTARDFALKCDPGDTLARELDAMEGPA